MRLILAAAALAAGAGLFLAAPAVGRVASPGDKPAHGGAVLGVHAHRVGWRWPLPVPTGADRPTVVRGFEPPSRRWQAGHRGVDLLAGVGEEVSSAGAGTVSFAGQLFGRPVVSVDHIVAGHEAVRTTYEPVDPRVKAGDRVRAGQVIGTISGLAGDPQVGHCVPRICLHWGVVKGYGHDERYLDPVGLVDRGPVRLLPVWGRR